ncbi:tol-pal system protein YbgF [Dyella sp.]|jgi:tol-pal system protein YbgF|uniref:tol-pal system protein YbgF n=1 Tax=Dyella sp. TaxID=1869338 RepID=UPI002D7907D0|nr:tol-pal system protein YbgF [Dyella sp.]HET6433305.1 tol-pal system protein YbgF [Dyella sp.]
MKKKLANSFAARIGMAGAIASAMLVAFPALAQDSRLSLAERVSRLEQQAQNQDRGGVGMVNQVQQLQSQVQQLQGQIEELQHQLQQLDEKSKAQYIDLDSRLGRLQGQAGTTANAAPTTGADAGNTPAAPATQVASPANGANAAAAPQATPAGADEQAAYDTAFKALRGGDYATASRGFRDFIQQHPDSALAPNAWYWLGESYYVTTNYPIALEAFQRLLSQFPQSDKAPDALLKVGYTQSELKQPEAAKATLQNVVSKYPGTKAASLAQERLNRIQLQSSVN